MVDTTQSVINVIIKPKNEKLNVYIITVRRKTWIKLLLLIYHIRSSSISMIHFYFSVLHIINCERTNLGFIFIISAVFEKGAIKNFL